MKLGNDRRGFIKKIGFATAAVSAGKTFKASTIPTPTYLKRINSSHPANDIKLAVIGAGGMGMEDVKTAVKHEGVQLVAACDLYKGRLASVQETYGTDIFVTDNFREILNRSDIDAVIIGTTDHWHKQISVEALLAGKHVYCEKPMVHSVEEGIEVIDAWKKSGKIFMVGSQGLSSLGNEKARKLLAEGAIGDLNYAEGFWARHSPVGAWQYHIPEDASEETVNWNRYISNTTKRPFDAMRFFRWRNYTDYGTAMSGDLFVHLFSSLHFIANSKGPNRVSAMGGLRYWKDGREVPDVLLGMFQYPSADEHPGFNLSLRCNFVDGTSGSTYLKLVGSKGSMDVEWRRVVLRRNTTPAADAFAQSKSAEGSSSYSGRKQLLPPEEIIYQAETDYKGAHYDHFANFFHAITTGGNVVEDPIFGFRAAAPALLCNDSFAENRFIDWDPVNLKVL